MGKRHYPKRSWLRIFQSKDPNIDSRKPLNLSKLNERSIYCDLSIGRPQNTEEKKEGFHRAASETNQIIHRGLVMRQIAVSHWHWWKFLDKGSVSSMYLEKTRQSTLLCCKTTF